jgi:hypothetical protein
MLGHPSMCVPPCTCIGGMQDCRTCGAQKVLAFLEQALRRFQPRYVLRVADSAAPVPQRLLEAAQQWTAMGAAYIGCMVHGAKKEQGRPVTLPQSADRDLIATQYPTHAAAEVYAISGHVAQAALVPNAKWIRHLDTEGVPEAPALELHCSCTAAALLLRWSCTSPALLLHHCYAGAAFLLHCCCTIATLELHCNVTAMLIPLTRTGE